MDAVEYLNKKARMSHNCEIGCGECPLSDFCCRDEQGNAEKMVDIVEKWSFEHPIKTRQSEFLKMFPNASIDHNGVLRIDPCFIDRKIAEEEVACNKFSGCRECRKNYWFEKIE